MIITNLTDVDYWFGPMHLPAGSGQTLSLDDTTDTSLYLLDDEVADAVNTLYLSSNIHASGYATPFPRPTGVPSLLHGDGSPEGMVYAPQGSLYMRRDSTQAATGLYTKTTGVTINTGWVNIVAPGLQFIDEVTVTTATESDPIYFESIPQKFSHLKIIASLSCASTLTLSMTINGNSGPKYFSQHIQSEGADSVTSTDSQGYTAATLGSVPSAGYFGGYEITLMGYTNPSVVPFTMIGSSSSEPYALSNYSTGLMVTSGLGGPVTSISLAGDPSTGGTFAAGSVATLYGLSGNAS